jgi:AraC-like DNA-binding protein
MIFSISDIFLTIAIFQLLFLSLFLFFEDRGKRISNILLGSFFLILCLNLTDSFLVLRKAYFSKPSLALWSNSFSLLYGPLLYLYTCSILYSDFTLTLKRWVHLLPFTLAFIISESLYLSLSHATQLNVLNNINEGKAPSYIPLISFLIGLQFFIYIWLSLRLINRYRQNALEKFSDQKWVSLSWLSSTILFFIFFIVIFAIHGVIRMTSLADYYSILLNVIILVLFVFINRVLYRALKKPEIFSLIKEKKNAGPNNTTSNESVISKYANSKLSDLEKKDILELLQLHMAVNKPFLDSELTLEQLAIQLNIKPRVLSQVINELLKITFFEFVNQFRIKEAQRLLTNPRDKKITILEVLYEVGFNSKSSFNTVFKKQTGLTPVEFKKKHLS